MRANHIQRAIYVSVLSTFLALVVCFSLAVGSANAHHSTQLVSSNSSTTAGIIDTQQGVMFSPNAITVATGTPVSIVNKTPFTLFFHLTGNGRLYGLNSRASLTITPTQSEQAILCSNGKSLTISVI